MLTLLLQRQVANAGIKLTINAALEQLSGITEVVNLFSPQEKPTKGRYRAEYVLSERSALQDRLCQILDIYKFT